jgi:hypothetical protein
MENPLEDLRHALSLIETALQILDRYTDAATSAAQLDMAATSLRNIIRDATAAPS